MLSSQLAETLSSWQQSYGKIAKSRIKANSVKIDNTTAKQRKECQTLANELKSQFNEWLKTTEFLSVRERLLVKCINHEVRILIHTADRTLLSLPWHLWTLVEESPQTEVALSFVNAESPSQSSQSSQRHFKILAIIGDDTDIDVEVDKQLLKELADVQPDNFLVKETRELINDRLWEQKWDILFFAGHSRTEGNQGIIYINETDNLTINQLEYALRKAVSKGLKLAIFNSCDGMGLAHELQKWGVPQVIMMREPVPDHVAHKFLKNFLTHFMSGKSLYLSVREARQQLQGVENDHPCASWLPVICQNPATTSFQRSSSLFFVEFLKKVAFASIAVSILLTIIILNRHFTNGEKAPPLKETANAYVKRGSDRRKQGDIRNAQEDFQKAIQLEPSHYEAYAYRGIGYTDFGLFKEALADFDRAIELKPDFAHAHKSRGIAKCKLGDQKGATSDFKKSFELFKFKGKKEEATIVEHYLSNRNACS
jgi:tetratricopeptide (TPR) repeat protein